MTQLKYKLLCNFPDYLIAKRSGSNDVKLNIKSKALRSSVFIKLKTYWLSREFDSSAFWLQDISQDRFSDCI